jgi:hypothetical protein
MSKGVRIELPPSLQELTGSQMVFCNVQTVRDLLECLVEQYRGFPCLFDEQNRLRSSIRIYVNQTSITNLNATLPANEPVRIAFFPFASADTTRGKCPPGRVRS